MFKRVTFWGVCASLVYIYVLAAFVKNRSEDFSALAPNAWGDFVAGAFGPLALLWLILGFFVQSRELQNSIKSLDLQTREFKDLVNQQREMVEILKEQHDFERGAFEQERHDKVQDDTPYIVIDQTSNMAYGERKEEIEKVESMLAIKNIGAGAKSVQFFCKENIHIAPDLPIVMSRGETRVIRITSSKSTLMMDTCILEIVSIGTKNHHIRQRFELAERQFPEISDAKIQT